MTRTVAGGTLSEELTAGHHVPGLATNTAVWIWFGKRYEETGFIVCGNAEILTGEDASDVVRRVHQKYLTDEAMQDPAVGGVFAAIDDIAIRLKPTRWISWDMPDLDQQAFGGRLRTNESMKTLAQ